VNKHAVTHARPFIAGNWKMHGLDADLVEVVNLASALRAAPAAARVAICPPSTLITRLGAIVAGTLIEVGAQDCRSEPRGAFTGDVSAEMLVDAGARIVILGHSERRDGYGETDAIVAAKVQGAIRAGLEPIVCVGESLEQRRSGRAIAIVEGQLHGSLPQALIETPFSVAYEPVWAIGSGLTPSLSEIEAVHGAIRDVLLAMFGEAGALAPILYGGSVKPGNAQGILAGENVNGALVGGASLKAVDFLPIVQAV
jgi:triosephosphate isomerase